MQQFRMSAIRSPPADRDSASGSDVAVPPQATPLTPKRPETDIQRFHFISPVKWSRGEFPPLLQVVQFSFSSLCVTPSLPPRRLPPGGGSFFAKDNTGPATGPLSLFRPTQSSRGLRSLGGCSIHRCLSGETVRAIFTVVSWPAKPIQRTVPLVRWLPQLGHGSDGGSWPRDDSSLEAG